MNSLVRRSMRLILWSLCAATLWAAPPNVIVLITDDQGYGELSAHGNPVLKTPHLDRLRTESVRLSDFHVAPMCTPTRGQLLTGLDAFRNGAMNVSSGRALLRRELTTMPQLFAAAGYATGIFGKWHLGDAFPYRPEDRGFSEALWFPSSHIGAVPDFWNNDYFDDTYVHNGRRQAYRGYTTDVFFREAMAWMQERAAEQKPFFCYLPTAAPHGPHFVPAQYREAVQREFDRVKDTLPKLPPGKARELVSYLAMIANIDENVGRLETFLRASGQRENTIVVFLTDNGSTFGADYFPAAMKGRKTTLWEGGHRVPCFVRWPQGDLRPPGDVAGLTQVQDLLPTLLGLCGVPAPASAKFDGTNLAPVLRGKAEPPADRMLVINYSRMPIAATRAAPDDRSVPRREGAAVLWQRWRLLEDRELYDLATDPLQERNVIAQHPEVGAKMRAHLDVWWAGVKDQCAKFQPSVIGSDAENPVMLTACEWADVFVDQQAQVRRGARRNGAWHVEVAQAGTYEFALRRYPPESGLHLTDRVDATKMTDGTYAAGPAFPIATATIQIAGQLRAADVDPGAASVTFSLPLPAGRTTLQTWFRDADGGEIAGAYYVQVTRAGTGARLRPQR